AVLASRCAFGHCKGRVQGCTNAFDFSCCATGKRSAICHAACRLHLAWGKAQRPGGLRERQAALAQGFAGWLTLDRVPGELDRRVVTARPPRQQEAARDGSEVTFSLWRWGVTKSL